MKTKKYTYGNSGASIEIRDSEEWEIPVTYCMGETHVGDFRYRQEFVATDANGEVKVCETFDEARGFIFR